jgi:hypothetical protein
MVYSPPGNWQLSSPTSETMLRTVKTIKNYADTMAGTGSALGRFAGLESYSGSASAWIASVGPA